MNPSGIDTSGGITALVLAGSRAGAADKLALHAGVPHKALAPVAGIPMVLRVIRTLQSCRTISRIVVSADRLDLLAPFAEAQAVTTRLSAASPSQSVAAALREFGAPLLVTTADHPLLTNEMLQFFINHAPAGSDAVAAVARSDVIRATYPTTSRTWLRFRNGDFSGCNLFLLLSPQAARAIDFWRRLEQQRKSPLAMARAIGPIALLGYLFRALTMPGALALLSHRTGARLAVVELPFADAAVDVDKPADLRLAETALAGRMAAA